MALGVLAEIEGVVGPRETGLDVARAGVDPVEVGQVARFAVVSPGAEGPPASQGSHRLADPPQAHAGDVEREERDLLGGEVQVDDAYLGGELSGDTAGRDLENKVPFLAAASGPPVSG